METSDHSSLILKAYGKINLSLDVVRRMGDGYHELFMMMQNITLHDTLTFNRTSRGTGPILDCDNPRVPLDSSNLIVKAAELLFKQYNIEGGLHIYLEKRIPAAAGLGGGSADAAATLVGINTLYDLGMTAYELKRAALSLGADVPFFLKGGLCICQGIGEILTKCRWPFHKNLVIVKPEEGMSTPEIYRALNMENLEYRPDNDKITAALETWDAETFYSSTGNVLMGPALLRLPAIGDIIAALKERGALMAMMSGSGPTVFGIFKDIDSAGEAQNHIRKNFQNIELSCLCGFNNMGVEVVK